MRSIFFPTLLVAPAFAGEALSEDAATVVDVAQVQVPAPTVYEAEIRPFHQYWPKLIKVPPGTTVIWLNRDVAEHNVHVLTGEKNPLNRDIVGRLAFPGEKFAITFHNEGSYRFFCDHHPYMQAYVVVESGARVEPHEERQAGAEQSRGQEDLTGVPLRQETGAPPGPRSGAAAAARMVGEW